MLIEHILRCSFPANMLPLAPAAYESTVQRFQPSWPCAVMHSENGGDVVAKETSHEFWIGPGVHLGLMVSPEFVAWGLTPHDSTAHSGGVEPIESWDPDVDLQEVVKVLRRVPDWDPAIEGLM